MNKIKEIVIKPATQKGKKLQAKVLYENESLKTIGFGAQGYSDYTIHKDAERKQRYLKRHEKDPKRIDTAGGLSRDILWSKPGLNEAVKFAANKHGVKIRLKK